MSILKDIPAFIPQVVIIALFALASSWAVRTMQRKTEAVVARRSIDAGQHARLKTLMGVGYATLHALIAAAAILMALYALGINVVPLLAGASIAGLAISLGAQALVKDLIGGFMILFENQFRVGDSIQVGDVSGVVEEITLRATLLRDARGRQFIIPNGDIRIVSNYSRDWARAVVDLNVPFDADAGQVVKALKEAMQKVATDETIKSDLLEAPQVLGWNSFTDSAVQVRLSARTLPGKHTDVERVMRQYALEALNSASLQINRH